MAKKPTAAENNRRLRRELRTQKEISQAHWQTVQANRALLEEKDRTIQNLRGINETRKSDLSGLQAELTSTKVELATAKEEADRHQGRAEAFKETLDLFVEHAIE